MFHDSDTWQLIINTGTTIVPFLMVFLIQNTQNRDAKAVHLKLNELIRALQGARNHLVDLEKLLDEELKKNRRRVYAPSREGEARGKSARRSGNGRAALILVLCIPRLTGADQRLATRTQPQDFALAAIGLARKATAPAVPDQPVAPDRPMLARHQSH